MLKTRVPPPLVTAFFAALMWLVAPYAPVVVIREDTRLGLSLISLVLGIVLCLAGVVSFKKSQTTVNPLAPDRASQLVDSGVYRISRNPMYLGMALFLLAWACYLPSLWTVLGVVAFIGYMNHYQIAPEERALKKLFGDQFRAYKRRVRRWI